jgi:hypothetical protein
MPRKKRYLALAHVNEPELTYRDIVVPHIVPLYMNFDESRPLGSARLLQKGEKIYAVIELDFNVSSFGRMPAVVLGVDEAERVIEDGICYLQNGVVTTASVVSNEIWKEVYGEENEEEHELV